MENSGYLILDMGDKYIFALIRDRNGNVSPCHYKTGGIISRYFFSDVCLDAELCKADSIDEEWLSDINKLIENPSDIFFKESVRRFREYELMENKEFIAVNPLNKISSYIPSENKKNILNVLSAFLLFLVRPIVRSAYNMGFEPKKMNVIAIVPSYLSHAGYVILNLILRRHIRFRKIFILNHASALAMHFLPHSKNIGILHEEKNCLHVSKVVIELKNNRLNVIYKKTSSIKELGWKAIVRKIARVFSCSEKVLERALLGLFTGLFSTDISPELHITYGLLEKKLNQEFKNEIIEQLKIIAKELEDTDQFVTYGQYFMIDRIEKIMSDFTGKAQRFHTSRILAPERTAYGVACMLNWQSENRNYTIGVQNQYAVRVACADTAVELIPASVLPKSGEHRQIRQVLALSVKEGIERDTMTADILWGNNLNPNYNTSLCTLTHYVTEIDIQNKNLLELLFDLKGKSDRVSGTVRAKMGNWESEPERLCFPGSMNQIFTQDFLIC